jgi:c-di-GMP-binding flagellar brake protein YcgR
MTGRHGANGAERRSHVPPGRPVRQHERKMVELRVMVVDADNRVRGKIRFDSRDLSIGGAFLRSDLLFEVDEEVQVEFSLPDGHHVRARGRVVRVSRDHFDGSVPGMGIKFLDLGDTDREAVRSFITKA